jgi:hypothetical protein
LNVFAQSKALTPITSLEVPAAAGPKCVQKAIAATGPGLALIFLILFFYNSYNIFLAA